jgi:hypothetical protein
MRKDWPVNLGIPYGSRGRRAAGAGTGDVWSLAAYCARDGLRGYINYFHDEISPT